MAQVALMAFAALLMLMAADAVSTNLADKNIRTGFGFLNDQAGFAIGETLIKYASTDTYGRAILVGLLNTISIAAIAIILSTILGFGICMARLSRNWLVARLGGLYVELVRNVPLLLQMFVWYALLLYGLPQADIGQGSAIASGTEPTHFFGLDNRGLYVPRITQGSLGFAPVVLAILAFFGMATLLRRERVGQATLLGGASAIGIFVLVSTFSGSGIDLPTSGRFGIHGGLTLSTEFITLIIGLSVYTAAYLAEIFRAAILAVPNGQIEAAKALGLHPSITMSQVILPQALRAAIPPMTSWHLNTLKNSTLGVAIGYPELVSIVDTTLSQTGQAIEGVTLIVVTFLTLSLLLSYLTSLYAKRFGWEVVNQSAAKASTLASGFEDTRTKGLVTWTKRNLFSSPTQSVVSVFVLLVFGLLIIQSVRWLALDAAFSGGSAACKLNTGACWPFLTQNARLILFGTYPSNEQWRGGLTIGLVLLALGLSFSTRLWGRRLAWVWLGTVSLSLLLMRGGLGVLTYVPMDKWSGLPVTLLLASIAVGGAVPIAVVLAFGRRSKNVAISTICIGFIEAVRGIPLIGVLFLAAVMFPLFVPSWLSIDSLPRVQLALILFTAAYMAEVLRGGLLTIPSGQAEAAQALGLGKWQARRNIILPQTLKVSLPGMVNTAISEVKNTTLVLTVGVFDLLQTTRLSYLEPEWRPYFVEAYMFSGTIFFLVCFALSQLGRKIERRLS